MSGKISAPRWLASVLVSALVGTGLALTSAAPAAAGNFNGKCESGEVCLWYQYNFSGPSADFYDAVSNYTAWHFYNSSYWLNDNTRSAKANTWITCPYLFEHANYGGRLIIMTKSEWMTSLNNGNVDLNDKVSSHDFRFCK